jgi:hypothetical protein
MLRSREGDDVVDERRLGLIGQAFDGCFCLIKIP